MTMRRFRGETLTLATTVAFPQVRGIPPGANTLIVEIPSSTLEQISLAFTPKIVKIWHYNGTTYTDRTAVLTDRNGTTNAALNSFTSANDILYIGCRRRFRGLAIDIGNANGNAATSDWEYWNGTAWTDFTETDGTASGGATFAIDGVVTWTTPTDWATTTVNAEPESLFWVRFKTSADFDATVSVIQITALANTTVDSGNTDAEGFDYLLLRSKNDTAAPYTIQFNASEHGGVEMKSASITSAANLNWLQVER